MSKPSLTPGLVNQNFQRQRRKLDFKCFLGSVVGTGLSPPELSVRRLEFQPGPGWYFSDPPGLVSPALFPVLSILLGIPVTFQHTNHWQQSLVYLKGFLWLSVTVLITDRWFSLPVSKSLSLLRLSLPSQASCYFQDYSSSISLSPEITQTQQLWRNHCVSGGSYNKQNVVESCHEEGGRGVIRWWHELSNQGNMWRTQRHKTKGGGQFFCTSSYAEKTSRCIV